MQEFYKTALAALILLLVADALAACFCIHQSYPTASLVPKEPGSVRWRMVTTTDEVLGGTSTIRILDSSQSLRFTFRVTGAATYPFVSADLLLEDQQGNAVPADLSRYTTATFVAKCAPANSLLFTMPVFDARASKPGAFYTYPSPGTYFFCSEQGTPVSLDLTRLTIPPWWFDLFKVDPSHQSYKLNQVAKFMFGVSHHSPRETDSDVEISDFTLHGRDDRYIAALAVILVASCSAYGIWFIRAHSRALVAGLEKRLKRDMHFVAYRQLTLEPLKDREKAAILQFIGAHYTDHDLDMGRVAARIGMDREKINEILKKELGMTFTGYVNKLKLTEAARLLTDKDSKPIADIAYSVGYANISYFNKLFKEEYGCTPKAFRNLATQPKSPVEHDTAGPPNSSLDDASPP
jgi:AraC-like DNA-binding protein